LLSSDSANFENSVGVSIEYLDDYTAKVTVTDATQITKDTDIIFKGGRTVDANTTVTISEYVESTNTSNILPRVPGFGVMTDHEGKRYYKTITHSKSWLFQVGVRILTTAVNGDYIIVSYPQIEIKPFASSFVIGSRPNGRLVIPVEDLKFDIANDDWVISCWKYPVATHTNGLNGHSINSFGRYTSGNTEGYIWWGKENNANTFRINALYNDGTNVSDISETFDPNWYFKNWHYEVILKNTNTIEYWVDGNLECSLNLTKDLNNNFTVGLTMSGYGGQNPSNSLITNLLVDKYTDKWTPEYINYIYKNKIRFNVGSNF